VNLRPDLELLAGLIPAHSRVLDLGCSSGALLAHLMAAKECRGTGVEIDPPSVVAAIAAGVPVIELDLDEQMNQFADKSYDVVVLSRTIQAIQWPEQALRHMARIGSRLIVSVPNFGWWGHRLRLLSGRMPMSKELPYQWYDTPNIRMTTLADLEDLFARLDILVERRFTYSQRGVRLHMHGRAANILAGAAVYVLRPSGRLVGHHHGGGDALGA